MIFCNEITSMNQITSLSFSLSLSLSFLLSQKESGLWGSLMIFCGLVGATIAGLLIDYTKKFKEITVVTLSLAILCLIWFTEVTEH